MKSRILITGVVTVGLVSTALFYTSNSDILVLAENKKEELGIYEKIQKKEKEVKEKASRADKIKYKNNKDKDFKSAEKFLESNKDNPHNRKDVDNKVKEKILYKNIKKYAPEITDTMNYVDPERQIYLVVSKFKEYDSPKLGTLKNVKVINIYDAETEEVLGTSLRVE
ncbi:hypothetical protein VQL36_14730 [Chengkuizengella sp. SCS-71B]|uniref:hypothetical protein n=1 Tax=Chengkuizengella sp. SCS-71B TaxID=3115290 RepID=UPI0032C23462